LTIEAWINLESFGSGSDVDIVLRKGEGNPNDYQLAIHDQKLALMIEENDDAGLESSASLAATTWYYLAGTWNGSIRRVYLNGSEDGSGSKNGSIIPDTRDIYIGGRLGTDLSIGVIDEVRASNTTRGATWIKASYETGRDDLLDFSSEEINIEDYVDNNTSEIGSPPDKGTHSNFTAQQYGPDSIYDTLTEENTHTLELWVDGFTAEEVLWVEVGAAPYLNAVDYATNYIWITASDNDYESRFDFANTSISGTINDVKICLYAMNEAAGNDEIEVYLYNSTGGPYSLAQFAPTAGSWSWYNYSCLSTLPTWTEVNNGQLRVRAEKILGGDNVYVDAALLFVNYTSSSYELDLEVQWTNVDFDEANEYLCIYGGTMSSENITVEAWNGSIWKNLFTDLSIGWNNVSVSSYLTSSDFTIKFKGGNETGDVTQDSWNIDATLLHIWTVDSTYDYVLRVNNTVTDSWEIRLKKYSNFSINRLENCTIYFHNSTDGTSGQIVIDNGSFNQTEGYWYDLSSLETIYIAITVEANSTGTSYVYTYLEIRKLNTTTYLQYKITFEIT